MRACLVSDLHFEINGYVDRSKYLKDGGDVLIVAGDLTSARFLSHKRNDAEARAAKKSINRFIKQWASNFKHVFYVLGNHDHYGCIIHESYSRMLDAFDGSNVRVMEDESFEFDGIHFYGSTLWTSFNNGDPNEMLNIGNMMNDYNWIFRKDPEHLTYVERNHPNAYVRSGRLLPIDVLNIHRKSDLKMRNFLKEHEKDRIVMITHHAPSFQCHNYLRYGNSLMHAYCNDYDDLMHQYDNIELWCFGHTHDSMDFKINKTRVLSNQCGYLAYERFPRNFEPLFIEI